MIPEATDVLCDDSLICWLMSCVLGLVEKPPDDVALAWAPPERTKLDLQILLFNSDGVKDLQTP